MPIHQQKKWLLDVGRAGDENVLKSRQENGCRNPPIVRHLDVGLREVLDEVFLGDVFVWVNSKGLQVVASCTHNCQCSHLVLRISSDGIDVFGILARDNTFQHESRSLSRRCYKFETGLQLGMVQQTGGARGGQ